MLGGQFKRWGKKKLKLSLSGPEVIGLKLLVLVYLRGWVDGVPLVLDLGVEAGVVVCRVGDHLHTSVRQLHSVLTLNTEMH